MIRTILTVKTNHLRCVARTALVCALLFGCPGYTRTQEPVAFTDSDVVEGSLDELKDKQRVLLVVTRSSVIDSRGLGKSVIADAYKADPRHTRRYRYTFNSIALKLNKYIRKYQSISAVDQIADADYILLFNLLEYRRSLGAAYPYGEMYAILNQPPASEHPPRIVWKAKKVMWAEDAANEFIKSLKAVRGER